MPDTTDINIANAPLIELVRNFCLTIEHGAEAEPDEFTAEMLDLLPRLYLGFSQLDPALIGAIGNEYLPNYLTEDYYDSIRRSLERLYGERDTYLETFEADMKYSDTPIAASISEGLADIFQPLYDCVCAIRESEGMQTATALGICAENFQSYWAQTLCNVLRPLNNIRYNPE